MADEEVELLDMELTKALHRSDTVGCADIVNLVHGDGDLDVMSQAVLENDVSKPRMRSIDGSFDARVVGDADVQIKRINEDITTSSEISASAADVDTQIRELSGTLSRASATFAAVRSQAATATTTLNNAGNTVPGLVASMSTTIGNLDSVKNDMASTLVANDAKVTSDLEAAQENINDLLETKLAQIRQQATAQFKKLTDKQEELIEKVVEPLDDVDAAGGLAVNKLGYALQRQEGDRVPVERVAHVQQLLRWLV